MRAKKQNHDHNNDFNDSCNENVRLGRPTDDPILRGEGILVAQLLVSDRWRDAGPSTHLISVLGDKFVLILSLHTQLLRERTNHMYI